MTMISKDSVTHMSITDEISGQRLDNFLLSRLKGVPTSHIYRVIRAGEVRVNKKRVNAAYRLQAGDDVRIPPIRIAESGPAVTEGVAAQYNLAVIYEDDALLVIDKPAGLAVHGGSGVNFGVIELLRKQRPESRFLELVHRLDRETSGVLMLAKKRSALLALHQMMRLGQIDKRYLVMVRGDIVDSRRIVKLPLLKYLLPNGERRVRVAQEGLFAHTVFTKKHAFTDYTLLEAQLKTGRTHQIRVHLASIGLPIIGDDKYGDFALNKQLWALGLKRMFLHAYSIRLLHPVTQTPVCLQALLPPALQQFMDKLDGQ